MFRDAENQTLSPTLQDFNKILEDRLNNKVDQEKYFMYIPIPLTYMEKTKSSELQAICSNESKTYDMYLF